MAIVVGTGGASLAKLGLLEAPAVPMKVMAQDSILSLERSNPKMDMVSVRVRRFSAGLEMAAFRTVVETSTYSSAVNALKAMDKPSTVPELFRRLYNQLDSRGANWESEQLEAGTMIAVGRMTFTPLPASIATLAEDPRIWGKELIRCSEGSRLFAFESVPSARPGKWQISVEEVGGRMGQSVSGRKEQASTHMQPERYSEFKAAIASDMPMDKVLSKFGLSL